MSSVTLGSLGQPSPDPGNLAWELGTPSGHVLVLHLPGSLFILRGARLWLQKPAFLVRCRKSLTAWVEGGTCLSPSHSAITPQLSCPREAKEAQAVPEYVKTPLMCGNFKDKFHWLPATLPRSLGLCMNATSFPWENVENWPLGPRDSSIISCFRVPLGIHAPLKVCLRGHTPLRTARLFRDPGNDALDSRV